MSLSRFIEVSKILLKLSIMKGIAWLPEGDFAEQFYLKLNLITEIIAGDEDSLKANLEEKVIIIIVNLEENVN